MNMISLMVANMYVCVNRDVKLSNYLNEHTLIKPYLVMDEIP